jgi:LacI family transcriptional regulator
MAVTMNDIAAKAGTSVAAVSVALNGAKSKTLRVGPEARTRILQAAADLGYRRHPLALALATGRSHVIGVMLPHAAAYTAEQAPFESIVVSGIVAAAAEKGYNVMLYSATAEDEGRRAEMIDRRIDGLLLVIPPEETPIYAECRRQEISYVGIVCESHVAPATVNSDDFKGGFIATQHLIELGHRRIAHLVGKPTVVTSDRRLRGYKSALQEAGLETDEGLVRDGAFSFQVGYDSTRALMSAAPERRPTAIFACNDLTANGALAALRDADLRVPEDVSVVGYDDTWYSTLTSPPLTTVRMHVHELGRCSADLMISLLDGGEIEELHPVLPVSLTIRSSTGPPSPH